MWRVRIHDYIQKLLIEILHNSILHIKSINGSIRPGTKVVRRRRTSPTTSPSPIILDEGEVTRSTRIDLRIHQGSRTWNEKKKAENSSCFLHLRRWEDVKYYLKWSLLQHIRNLWSRIKCCLKLWCFQSLASASHHTRWHWPWHLYL